MNSGTATATLVLRTDKGDFTVGLDAALVKVRGFKNGVQDAAGALPGLGKALAGAFASASILAAGKQVIDFAGEVTDLAGRLSVSTSTVQEWKATFGAAGVELGTVAKASEELSKRLLDGDEGAVGALKAMGQNVEALRAMKPEDRLIAVADAVGRIADSDEKLYASKALFGKGGAEMLSALDGNLGSTIDRMRDLGIVIDEETIAAADDFGDQLGFMGQQLLAITASIIGPLLPALSALGNVLMWIGNNVLKPVINEMGVQLPALFNMLWLALTKFLEGVIGLAEKIPFLGERLGFLGDAKAWLAEQSAKSTERLKEWAAGGKKVEETATKTAPKLLGLGDASEKAATKHKKQSDELGKLKEKIDDIDASVRKGLWAPTAADLSDSLDAYMEGLRQFAELRDRALAIEQGQGSGGVWNIGVQLDVEGAKADLATLNRLAEESLGGQLNRIVRGLPELLQQALTGGGGFKGFAQAITSQIGSALGGKLFTAGGPMNGLGNKLAGIFGDSFGLALPGIGQALGALVGPVLAKLWGVLKQAFGGPSQQELEGRGAEQAFQDKFSSFEDMVNSVGDAYAATGRSREEAQAAVQEMLNAERFGAEAVEAVLRRIQGVMDDAARARDGATRFGPSKAELEQAARDAQATFEYMNRLALESGQYTQEQLDAAYMAWQEAMAAAGDEAAAAWVKARKAAVEGGTAASSALDDLRKQRESLAQSIADEAPEEVMGSIEAATRGQMAALDAQIADQQRQIEAAATSTADAAEDSFNDIQIDPVEVRIVWRPDPLPGGGQVVVPEPIPMARGGFGSVSSPTLFLAGEAGSEEFAFSGAGKRFAASASTDMSALTASVNGLRRHLEVRLPIDLARAVRDEAQKVAFRG